VWLVRGSLCLCVVCGFCVFCLCLSCIMVGACVFFVLFLCQVYDCVFVVSLSE